MCSSVSLEGEGQLNPPARSLQTDLLLRITPSSLKGSINFGAIGIDEGYVASNYQPT